jgi:hypothetical protein
MRCIDQADECNDDSGNGQVSSGQLNTAARRAGQSEISRGLLPDYADICLHLRLPLDGDFLYGRKLRICRGEALLERGMPELVNGACLPQHLPAEGFLKEVQEMHPAVPLASKH